MAINIRVLFVSVAFVLLSMIIVGLASLSAPEQLAPLALAYAAGISMIFLPCTLPLVFVIIPLSMGRGYIKGLTMAVLFGLGLSITLMFYGIITAAVGGYIGLNQAVSIMFMLAGVAAVIFGLSELKVFRIPLPQISVPGLMGVQSEYVRAFGLGLLLGNAGVGCPNPAFYVMLGYIATIGTADVGAVFGFLHGLGRATPLIFLSILAILGVNMTNWIVQRREVFEKWLAWGLIIIGAFILNYGIFGMAWFENSAIHIGWNNIVAAIAPEIAESAALEELLGIEQGTGGVGPWIVFSVIVSAAIILNAYRQKREKTKNMKSQNKKK